MWQILLLLLISFTLNAFEFFINSGSYSPIAFAVSLLDYRLTDAHDESSCPRIPVTYSCMKLLYILNPFSMGSG